MTYLILSIICATLLNLIFKLFHQYKIHLFQAIVFNYLTCFTIGLMLNILLFDHPIMFDSRWLWAMLSLGGIFISGFYIIGVTVRHFGVGITTIAQRTSLVFSSAAAIIFFGEASTWVKWTGIVLAVIAIYLINQPSGRNQLTSNNLNGWYLFLPLLTFLVNGIIEIILLIVDKTQLVGDKYLVFTAWSFGVAGIVGIFLLTALYLTKKISFKWRYLWGGILLGIPNLGSILFILLGLAQGLDGSFFFPISNVTVLILSVVLGYLVFRENLSTKNLIGFICSMVSIILIIYAAS